jgi:hypothetical protein
MPPSGKGKVEGGRVGMAWAANNARRTVGAVPS